MSETIEQDDLPLKRCSNPECHKWLPATPDYFHRHKEMKDGLQFECKECKSKRSKAYNSRPEVQKHNQTYQQTYYNQPEKRAHKTATDIARQRARRNSPVTRESVLAYDKEFRNRPGRRERRHADWKSWHTKNKDYRRDYEKVYHALPETKEKRRGYQANREARKKAIAGTHTPTQIREQLKLQHYRCYYAACGHAKFEKIKGKYIYHVDHTFPISRVVGTDIPANDMSYLVLACPCCNDSKGDRYPWEWFEGGKLL